MKQLPVINLSFVEIGGVGEMVYRAVRFPEYIPDYDDDGEIIKPLFTGSHAPSGKRNGLFLDRARPVGQPVQSLWQIK